MRAGSVRDNDQTGGTQKPSHLENIPSSPSWRFDVLIMSMFPCSVATARTEDFPLFESFATRRQTFAIVNKVMTPTV